VIDPVLDFDGASGTPSTGSADRVARFLEEERIRTPYVLDTHADAGHLSALPVFEDRFGAQTAIGAGIVDVQRTFRDLFNLGDDLPTDSRQFDRLLADGEKLDLGPFALEALHTSARMSYRIEDAVFIGDTLFRPDYGTARCDVPDGSAAAWSESIQGLYRRFPAETRLFTGHDDGAGGRELAYESTLGEQREANVRAGAFPEPEENGRSYLKIPLNAFAQGSPS